MKSALLSAGLVGVLMLTGCSNEGEAGRSTTPTPAVREVAATPQLSSSAAETAGSSTGGGSGSTSGGALAQTTGGAGHDDKTHSPSPGKTPSEAKPSLSPEEWRRKNFKPRPFSDFENLEGYEEVRMTSTVPPSSTSIREGRKLYAAVCAYCHDMNGKPVRKDPALIPYNMADLSKPQEYKYGSEAKAIFRSIAYGVGAPPMPGIKSEYSEQEIWDLTNFVHSLQR